MKIFGVVLLIIGVMVLHWVLKYSITRWGQINAPMILRERGRRPLIILIAIAVIIIGIVILAGS